MTPPTILRERVAGASGDLSGLPALSIMQPWPWLIAHGHKDIENRGWPTRFRGRFLIHAGKKMDGDALLDMEYGQHPVTGGFAEYPGYSEIPNLRGGIVGIGEIVDCVTRSGSPWFVGPYGFAIRNARPLAFIPCKGALGFFTPDLSALAATPPAGQDSTTTEDR